MLPDRDVAAIRQFCDERIPPGQRSALRGEAEVEPTAVTIVERRAPWGPQLGPDWSTVGVARLRYTATRGVWTLQSADAHGRWRKYELIGPASSVGALLAEIDRDPTGIFWG